jgi:hypothetical protein
MESVKKKRRRWIRSDESSGAMVVEGERYRE